MAYSNKYYTKCIYGKISSEVNHSLSSSSTNDYHWRKGKATAGIYMNNNNCSTVMITNRNELHQPQQLNYSSASQDIGNEQKENKFKQNQQSVNPLIIWSVHDESSQSSFEEGSTNESQPNEHSDNDVINDIYIAVDDNCEATTTQQNNTEEEENTYQFYHHHRVLPSSSESSKSESESDEDMIIIGHGHYYDTRTSQQKREENIYGIGQENRMLASSSSSQNEFKICSQCKEKNLHPESSDDNVCHYCSLDNLEKRKKEFETRAKYCQHEQCIYSEIIHDEDEQHCTECGTIYKVLNENNDDNLLCWTCTMVSKCENSKEEGIECKTESEKILIWTCLNCNNMNEYVEDDPKIPSCPECNYYQYCYSSNQV